MRPDGSIALWVAVPTGEAAGELAERNAAVNQAIEQHETLGETSRTLFTILTLVFGIIVLGRRNPPGRMMLTSGLMSVGFLGFYFAAMLILANTAHNGGRLVHELGIHALVSDTNSSWDHGREHFGEMDDD